MLNGFHETWPIEYPRGRLGLARTGQTIVPAPDGSVIRLYVDDEPFVLGARGCSLSSACSTCERSAHARAWSSRRRAAIASRSARGGSPPSAPARRRRSTTRSRRSTARPRSRSLRARHARAAAPNDRRPAPRQGLHRAPAVPLAATAGGRARLLQLATRNSGLELAAGIDHASRPTCTSSVERRRGGDHAASCSPTRRPGKSLRLQKFVALPLRGRRTPAGELERRVKRTLDRAARDGTSTSGGPAAPRGESWQRSDVEVERRPRRPAGHALQPLPAAAGHRARRGPRGRRQGRDRARLRGPLLLGHRDLRPALPGLHAPRVRKQLLQFRYGMLDRRASARGELGHRGALFPWRTITGEEASAYYAAGTAQYHINADIAYAMHQYIRVTGDHGFMLDQGAPGRRDRRLLGGARLLRRAPRRRFCIGGDRARRVLDRRRQQRLHEPDGEENLGPPCEWPNGCSARTPMRTPRSSPRLGSTRRARRVAPRGDGDVRARTTSAGRAAGRALPRAQAMGLRRHAAGQLPAPPALPPARDLPAPGDQADRRRARTYLVGDHFSAEEKRRTFDYYDPLTTGDSCLSACVQSVMASEVGYSEAALDYFLTAGRWTSRPAGNTADGIHVASCGGTWLALVAGFGGLRDSTARCASTRGSRTAGSGCASGCRSAGS